MKYFCSIRKTVNITGYLWSRIPQGSEVELTARAVSRVIVPDLTKTDYSRIYAENDVLVITQLEYKEVEASSASEALDVAFPQLKGIPRAADSTDDAASLATKVYSHCSFTAEIHLSNFDHFLKSIL